MELAAIALGLLAGLGAGVLHVVSGPDHLAALSPLALTRGSGAWRLGVRWGLGHSLGTACVAGLALFVRQRLDLQLWAGWGERLVGLSLIAIALWTFRRALASHLHVHRHSHDGVEHVHAHLHAPRHGHARSAAAASPSHAHSHAATGIGLLHGLTGGSHVVVTLPALALPLAPASAYLSGFMIGSVLAMAIFAQVLGSGSGRLPARVAGAHRWLLVAAGCAALVTGAWWVSGRAW